MKYLSVILLLFCLNNCFAINAKGCIPLDSWSFDKVVSKFPSAIVKFDKAYPYGKKQDEFIKFSSAARHLDDFLVAEVGVKDYGDMQNTDLVQRFDVNTDEFPVVKLFTKSNKNPIDFKGDFTNENLKKFVKENAEVYIGLEHCLPEFDKIADQFMRESDESKRKELLIKAESQTSSLKNPESVQSAEAYLKIMKKALEKGNSFPRNERERVAGLLESKLNEEKKKKLQSRLNILSSFIHDEL